VRVAGDMIAAMCARYLTPEQAAIERHWRLTPEEAYRQIWNVAPTSRAPVIRLNADGAWEVTLFHFGFQPTWGKRAWVNARCETLFSSNAFASAARKRRCLVPAVGWYEWQGSESPKQPYVFHLDGFRPFAFAGIWTARRSHGGWSHNFAIVTRPALPYLERIHDRMPAILNPRDYQAWLSPETEHAESLLGEPFTTIAIYPVSTYVNKPANDDARCIEPI
jgi:putative SOS response-associated peptidase YedK